MLIEKVDAIRFEPLKRSLHGFANVRWPAVDAGDLSVLEREAELRRDRHSVASTAPELLQCSREQLLVPIRPVRFGGVEERTSLLDRAVYRRNGFALVPFVCSAIRMRHPHEAEADRRDREALRAELACWQHIKSRFDCDATGQCVSRRGKMNQTRPGSAIHSMAIHESISATAQSSVSELQHRRSLLAAASTAALPGGRRTIAPAHER